VTETHKHMVTSLHSFQSNHSVTTRALWMRTFSSYWGVAKIITLSMSHSCVEAHAFNILCIAHLLKCFHYFGSYLWLVAVGYRLGMECYAMPKTKTSTKTYTEYLLKM
jgi:hypothetical protein